MKQLRGEANHSYESMDYRKSEQGYLLKQKDFPLPSLTNGSGGELALDIINA